MQQRTQPGDVPMVAPPAGPHLADGGAELVMTRAGLMLRVRCYLHDWKALRATTADLDCPGCVAAEQIVRDGETHDSLI
jgi:hypothetical protein